MRAIFTAFLGACLLGLMVGCGGGSNRVEMPANPTPPPKNPTFSSSGTPAGTEGGARRGVPPPPPPPSGTVLPKK